MSALVSIERPEPGVAVLAMHDAAGKNTFTGPFHEQLLHCVEDISGDRTLKVCVLRGLPEVFCGGAPQELLMDLAAGRMAPSDIVLSKVLLDLPIPTIAAMEGHAVGGGLALGLCCDMVLMARESRYGCSFMNLGFTPGMGITRTLQLAFGDFVANEMMLGGQMFKGSHFEAASGVNYLLPRPKLLAKAMDLATRIAEKPRTALELLKRNLSVSKRRAFEESRTMEALMHQVCFHQGETATLIKENYVPGIDEE